MARTDTQVYRRFRGTLSPSRPAFLTLAVAGYRTAARRKLALVLLYAPPAIATVIFGFVIYARFAVEAGATPLALGGDSPAAPIAAGFAQELIQVRRQIVLFQLAMSAFTVLVIAWYGSGLVAEDRRVGAFHLYFARPLRLRDYLLGKFTTLVAFAAPVVLLPGLVMCAIAAFSSQDWAFLEQEGEVIPVFVLHALSWMLVWCSVQLAVSCFFARRTTALVASMALFLVPHVIAVMLSAMLRDSRFLMLSLQGNFLRISAWSFEMPRMGFRLDWSPGWAMGVLAAWTVVAWCAAWWRVRRLEAAT